MMKMKMRMWMLRMMPLFKIQKKKIEEKKKSAANLYFFFVFKNLQFLTKKEKNNYLNEDFDV